MENERPSSTTVFVIIFSARAGGQQGIQAFNQSQCQPDLRAN